jgi:hypothetical protein
MDGFVGSLEKYNACDLHGLTHFNIVPEFSCF